MYGDLLSVVKSSQDLGFGLVSRNQVRWFTLGASGANQVTVIEEWSLNFSINLVTAAIRGKDKLYVVDSNYDMHSLSKDGRVEDTFKVS